MKRLNIFVDESGSVSPLDGNIPKNIPLSDNFYVISLVFIFDDDETIYETIRKFNELRNNFGITKAIHYGPLIRREDIFYKQFSIDEIRKIYFRTARIMYDSSMYYTTITLNKKMVNSIDEFESYLIDNFANTYYSNIYF